MIHLETLGGEVGAVRTSYTQLNRNGGARNCDLLLGKFLAIAGSAPQAWADGAEYMNKQVAEKTQLTNVGVRTYDPVLDKFLSVDPVIDVPRQVVGRISSISKLGMVGSAVPP